jgi:hypothetical protein
MSDEYEVEEIIGKRLNHKGQTQYLIKWEGYSIEDSTWEPLEHLSKIKTLIKMFEEKSKRKEILDNVSNKVIKAVNNPPNNSNNLKVKQSYEIIDEIGSLIPSSIITVRLIDNKLHCLVDFLQTASETLQPAYVPSNIIKETYPKILIDYYESKLRFVPANK